MSWSPRKYEFPKRVKQQSPDEHSYNKANQVGVNQIEVLKHTTRKLTLIIKINAVKCITTISYQSNHSMKRERLGKPPNGSVKVEELKKSSCRSKHEHDEFKSNRTVTG